MSAWEAIAFVFIGMVMFFTATLGLMVLLDQPWRDKWKSVALLGPAVLCAAACVALWPGMWL